jgi:hypothetical protein
VNLSTLKKTLNKPVSSSVADARVLFGLGYFIAFVLIVVVISAAIKLESHPSKLLSEEIPALHTMFRLREIDLILKTLLMTSWLWLWSIDYKAKLLKRHSWKTSLRTLNPFDRSWANNVGPTDVTLLKAQACRIQIVLLLSAAVPLYLEHRMRTASHDFKIQSAAYLAKIKLQIEARKKNHFLHIINQ